MAHSMFVPHHPCITGSILRIAPLGQVVFSHQPLLAQHGVRPCACTAPFCAHGLLLPPLMTGMLCIQGANLL